MNFLILLLASTASSTVLILVVAWLFRELIKARLKASVEHEFNAKLASVQSEQRKHEESFKAELRQRESAIQALQGGALSSLASRQAANNKRRLDAIDDLWASVQTLSPALAVVQSTSFLKYEACMKEAAKSPKFRTMFTIHGDAGQNAIKGSGGWAARPHVTKLAWAYFVAYRAILGFYVVRMTQLQLGLDTDFSDHEAVKKVVLAALPHQAQHIEHYGVGALYTYVGELESKLLDEFATMLTGRESDLASVEHAAAIIGAVDASNKSSEQTASQVEMALAEARKNRATE